MTTNTKNTFIIEHNYYDIELSEREIRQINRIVDLYNTMSLSNDVHFDSYSKEITIQIDCNWSHKMDQVSALRDTLESIKSFARD